MNPHWELLSSLKLNFDLWCAWFVLWGLAAKWRSKTKAREAFSSRLLHLLPIAVGYALIFSDLPDFLQLNHRFLPKTFAVGALGNLATLSGLCFTAWARIHLGKNWSAIVTLKEGHTLIQSGPYRLARHPIYTGFVFGMIGSAIVSGRIGGILAVGLTVGAFLRKIQTEEKFLLAEFGVQYQEFRKNVKALIPYVL